ncbi:MAG: phosphoadenosine phosphosulfate reductase family protein [Nitrospirae bacterium]|nr:phosphoadenosine phosphosulfate reductase family protein [Nitrospirota bacterium]
MSVEELIDEIKGQLRPVNIVSFSGGKDSTMVLSLVIEALKDQPDKRLIVLTADTLIEIPYYAEYVRRITERLRDYFATSFPQGSVVVTTPEVKQRFFYRTLGLGYPAPFMKFRWCTGGLKVDPIFNFQKTLNEDYKVFIGVRQVESKERAERYKKKDFLPKHFAPILFLENIAVWEYLLIEECVWGGDHKELIEVYRFASDECIYGLKEGVCVGNARYGCWICPLQRNNQLDLIAHYTKDSRYQLLKYYKNQYARMSENPAHRSNVRRNGESGQGPFILSARQILFHELQKLEQMTGWTFCDAEQEAAIYEAWENDDGLYEIPVIDDLQLSLW